MIQNLIDKAHEQGKMGLFDKPLKVCKKCGCEFNGLLYDYDICDTCKPNVTPYEWWKWYRIVHGTPPHEG